MTKFDGIALGGILSKMSMPRSCRRCSTRASAGARLTTTWPFFVSHQLAALARQHLDELLVRAAVDLDPEPLEGVGGEEALRRVLDERVQAGGDRRREELRARRQRLLALALTSTFANSVLVTLSAIAAWMRGSEASGLTVRT